MASHFQKHTQNSVHTMNQLCDKVHCWLMNANKSSHFPKTTESLINALRSAKLLFLRETADVSSVLATLEDLGIVVRATKSVHPKSKPKGVTRTPISFEFPSSPSAVPSQHDNANATSLDQWAVEQAIRWLLTRNRQSSLPSNVEALTNDLGNVCVRQSTVSTSLLLTMLQHRGLITIAESTDSTGSNRKSTDSERKFISPGEGINILPLSIRKQQEATNAKVAKRKEKHDHKRRLEDRKRRFSGWGLGPTLYGAPPIADGGPPLGIPDPNYPWYPLPKRRRRRGSSSSRSSSCSSSRSRSRSRSRSPRRWRRGSRSSSPSSTSSGSCDSGR
eukprot:TRINITY_DN17832_c0_g2_i1.p1 TRINITY_DN17832_c0_g2~~TRINITY_DN17832_c0_g2_i1.p1  ORF type:complete len:332 (+),score=-1.14 TRINITY_DN17832_c0_g2_i1:27-1022(+)